jgi:hypothetical protein
VKTTRLSPISESLNPSTLSPNLSRIKLEPWAGTTRPGPGTGVGAASRRTAYRLLPKIAVPSRTMLRTRWNALELVSTSLFLPSPRSGSKRFLLTITSVPTRAGAFVSNFSSLAAGKVLAFPGLGRSQGPSFQRKYVRAPTATVATRIRTVSNEERFRIAKSSHREMIDRRALILRHLLRKSKVNSRKNKIHGTMLSGETGSVKRLIRIQQD